MQPASPAEAYAALVSARALSPDSAQQDVVDLLQALHEVLEKATAKGKRLFFNKKLEVRGLYIWGNVGRGKSMLMDLFCQHAPVEQKERIHFHTFIQQVHARLHQLRQHPTGDPVQLLVKELAARVKLLCFDELQANDVADATLLFRLFDGLFAAGVVIVATSNHPPETLYTGGVQRERFQKFITLLHERMDVVSLTSPHDYRYKQIQSLTRRYYAPLGADARRFVEEALAAIASGERPSPRTLSVQGRELTLTAYGQDTVAASFAQLCEQPLGTADYLALAEAFDTLVLTGVPVLSPEKRNEAKRFVTLIDALYELKVRLIITAEASPEALYPAGDGSFEFQRTVSRLVEMQSEKYVMES